MYKHLKLLPLLATLAAVGCAFGVRNRMSQHWVGEVTPFSGGGDCIASRGVLTLREGKVTFAPDEGTWVLDGQAQPSTLEASKTRETPDRKLYETKLQARWNESSVIGTYTTPLCQYRVTLSAF